VAGSVVAPVRPRPLPSASRNRVVEVGPARPRETRWRGEPISLSLRDAPLPEVLRTFAKMAGVNLILDPRVQGSVTVELKDVPWDQALHVILRTHGMAAEIDGRVWLVTPN
jgi:type IV pilus assembly protein PilQ